MDAHVQNMSGQAGPPIGLGRIVRRTEIWTAPYSKRTVELLWVEETFEQDGVFVTKQWTQTCPELDDGTTPESVKELRECPCCWRIVTRSCVCPDCGLEFYWACTREVEKKEEKKRVCRGCAAKAEHPIVFEIRNFLWGD